MGWDGYGSHPGNMMATGVLQSKGCGAPCGGVAARRHGAQLSCGRRDAAGRDVAACTPAAMTKARRCLARPRAETASRGGAERGADAAHAAAAALRKRGIGKVTARARLGMVLFGKRLADASAFEDSGAQTRILTRIRGLGCAVLRAHIGMCRLGDKHGHKLRRTGWATRTGLLGHVDVGLNTQTRIL